MIEPNSITTNSNYRVGDCKIKVECGPNKEIITVGISGRGELSFVSKEEMLACFKGIVEAFRQ